MINYNINAKMDFEELKLEVARRIRDELDKVREEMTALENEGSELDQIIEGQENLCDYLELHLAIIDTSNSTKDIFHSRNAIRGLLGAEIESSFDDDFHSIENPEFLPSIVSLYVEEEVDGVLQYGRVIDRSEKEVWLHCFKPDERPGASDKIIPYKDFLSRFDESAEHHHRSVFFLVSTKQGRNFEVVIKMDGPSDRAKNFNLLCSAHRGISYRGMALEKFGGTWCGVKKFPIAVEPVTGKNNVGEISLDQGDVYGMTEVDSYFWILLKDGYYKTMDSKFGMVEHGLNDLIGQEKCRIVDCGVVFRF